MTAPAAVDVVATLDALERELDARHPQRLTEDGARERAGEWDDLTLEGADAEAAALHDVLRRTDRLVQAARTRRERTCVSLYRRTLAQRIASARGFLHAYPVNQMLGVPNQTGGGLRVTFFLKNVHPLDSRDDVETFVARLAGVGPHLRRLVASLRDGARRGIVLPGAVLDATRAVCLAALRGAPFDGGPSHPLLERLADALPRLPDVGAAQASAFLRRATDALATSYRDGHVAVLDWLEDLARRPRTTLGVCALPGGEAFYVDAVELWSGAPRDPDALHALGLKEVERLQAEAAAILRTLGYRGGYAELAAAVRADARAYYPNDEHGREEYLERARGLARAIGDRLPDVVDRVPSARLEIRRVEPYRESSAAFGEYYPPSADGRRPSLYYVNLADMARLPRQELAPLTFHEGVPGHHLQIARALEDPGLPRFLRRPFAQEAYAEGWAMYAEQLGEELLGEALEPLERYGRVSRALWMAARLVVDTGVHARHWTRSQAIAYLRGHTGVPPAQIELEVDRYAVWPGQATAYHAGLLEFLGLRDAARHELGACFRLRDFHTAVLATGAVPLDVLREEMRAWQATALGTAVVP